MTVSDHSRSRAWAVRLRERIDGIVACPLFGVDRTRTLVGIGAVAAFLALVALGQGLVWLLEHGVSVWVVASAVEFLRWLTIAVATLSTFLLALCYAGWNGGPALAFGIAASPKLAAIVTRGQFHLSVDLVLALTAGALAATTALYANDRRLRAVDASGYRPTAYPGLEDCLLFVTSVTIVAMVALWRYVRAIPESAVVPYGYLLVPAVCATGAYWYVWAAASASTSGDGSADAGRSEP